MYMWHNCISLLYLSNDINYNFHCDESRKIVHRLSFISFLDVDNFVFASKYSMNMYHSMPFLERINKEI